MKYIVEFSITDSFVVDASNEEEAKEIATDMVISDYDVYYEEVDIISVKEYK